MESNNQRSPGRYHSSNMLEQYKDLSKNYQEAYSQIDEATVKINKRLDRLKYEQSLLKGTGNSQMGYHPNPHDRRNLMNPNLYSHQFHEPLYYPLENPINGEPVSLPRIELGQPLDGGLKMDDLQELMKQLGMKINKDEQKPLNGMGEKLDPNDPFKDNKEEQKKKMEDSKRKLDEPKKKLPVKPIPKDTTEQKKDWWRIARGFVNLWKFYSTAKKYAKHASIRNKFIADNTKDVYGHIDSLKNWIIGIERSLWEEFKVFKDMDLTMASNMGELKLKENAQKITVLLKTFFKNLIQKTNNGTEIPDGVQQIMYNYIRDKAYYPQKYLSTFEINRLDFNFYGGTKNMSDTQLGMLLAFLVISRTTVQQILLHPLENFPDFRGYPKLPLSCKYLGSILHYITRDAFSNSPPMEKDSIAQLNYYRNYHIPNQALEAGFDGVSSTWSAKDQDEISQNLVTVDKVSEYWKHAPEDVKILRSWIYSWAINIGKFIRTKFRKFDRNNNTNKNTTTKAYGL
jgi:hypothetical protein